MWYVIQTSTGREEKIKQECEQRISKDVLSHCVLPLYEEKIKYKGQWHIQKKKLFPGYLFLISENLDELHEQLKRVEAMTKLLGAGDDIIALTQNEIDDFVATLPSGLKPKSFRSKIKNTTAQTNIAELADPELRVWDHKFIDERTARMATVI